jgi:hypothetical protein
MIININYLRLVPLLSVYYGCIKSKAARLIFSNFDGC